MGYATLPYLCREHYIIGIMHLDERIHLLSRISVFAHTEYAILREIAEKLVIVHLSIHQDLFQKGQSGDGMYIILEGNVCIHDNGTVFNELFAGDVLGELAILDNETRIATATAKQDSTLLHLSPQAFNSLLDHSSDVGRSVLRHLSISLRSKMRDLLISQRELIVAYDACIEGWSRALDLRDKETEGHSKRVTVLTVQLARHLGLSESQITHIQRGALLHDIGKMGIPDYILLKPDHLSLAEWDIMRKHPQYAFDMLHPIEFLHPALDIPYAHHEKWDGSGYPRQLKGEEIPLAARMFALVDVWDALTNDRPYRPAWSTEKALAYIQEQAGIHFDPKLTPIFIELILQQQDLARVSTELKLTEI